MNQTPPVQQPKKVPLVLVSGNLEEETKAIPAIEQHGFEVLCCTDGKKALSIQDTKPPLWKPGLFLVDVVMPLINSYDLVRQLVDKWGEKKVLVVMMAQNITSEDLLESTSAGAVGMLKKPLCWKALDDVFEKERMKRLRSEITELVFRNDA